MLSVVNDACRRSAEAVRTRIEHGTLDVASFRGALLQVPPTVRDAWIDVVFRLAEPPDDGPELPRGCVPYLPCSVEALLRTVELAPVRASDVFVDIGAGIGRATALVHLLTGASAIGLEIQPRLVAAARDLASRLCGSRITYVEGDAAELTGYLSNGSVFLLYCPFSGARLSRVLADLELVARTRAIRVCCVHLPLPPCPSLTLQASVAGLSVYQSARRHDPKRASRESSSSGSASRRRGVRLRES